MVRSRTLANMLLCLKDLHVLYLSTSGSHICGRNSNLSTKPITLLKFYGCALFRDLKIAVKFQGNQI